MLHTYTLVSALLSEPLQHLSTCLFRILLFFLAVVLVFDGVPIVVGLAISIGSAIVGGSFEATDVSKDAFLVLQASSVCDHTRSRPVLPVKQPTLVTVSAVSDNETDILTDLTDSGDDSELTPDCTFTNSQLTGEDSAIHLDDPPPPPPAPSSTPIKQPDRSRLETVLVIVFGLVYISANVVVLFLFNEEARRFDDLVDTEVVQHVRVRDEIKLDSKSTAELDPSTPTGQDIASDSEKTVGFADRGQINADNVLEVGMYSAFVLPFRIADCVFESATGVAAEAVDMVPGMGYIIRKLL